MTPIENAARRAGKGRASQSAPYPGGTYAFITGASEGLGRALAEECARLGLNLALVALPESGLPQAAQELVQRYGVQAGCLETDLTAPSSTETVASWVADRSFPISVLINNAGVGCSSRFADATLTKNETCILLNDLALVRITHLLLPELQRHPRASVLNVASLAAFFPMPFSAVYSSSKAFVLNFSLALRAEMQSTPVSVSVLCPNGMRTNRASHQRIAANGLLARLTCKDPKQVAAYAIRGMLAGRAVLIPGSANRVIALAAKVAPRWAVYAVVSRIWGRIARTCPT